MAYPRKSVDFRAKPKINRCDYRLWDTPCEIIVETDFATFGVDKGVCPPRSPGGQNGTPLDQGGWIGGEYSGIETNQAIYFYAWVLNDDLYIVNGATRTLFWPNWRTIPNDRLLAYAIQRPFSFQNIAPPITIPTQQGFHPNFQFFGGLYGWQAIGAWSSPAEPGKKTILHGGNTDGSIQIWHEYDFGGEPQILQIEPFNVHTLILFRRMTQIDQSVNYRQNLGDALPGPSNRPNGAENFPPYFLRPLPAKKDKSCECKCCYELNSMINYWRSNA